MDASSIGEDDLRSLLPKATLFDWDLLSSTKNEEDFSRMAFELLKECGGVTAAIAGIQASPTLDRNHAICNGLAVRLVKLEKLIIRDLSERETFQQLSIARQIFETAGTLVYLINDGGNGDRYDRYVQDSLVSEKVMLDDILRNIKKRSGEVWHIEERMRSSIEKTARAGGIDDISTIPKRAVINFPNAETLMTNLGKGVYIAYRAGSAEVHGSWSDLYKYHLNEVSDGEFVPNLDSPPVQPNVATTTVSVLARVFGAYLDWLAIDNISKLYDPVLAKIIENNDKLVSFHENYIARK